ncbi:hypothetical protein JXQ70_03225 [bacterium]|nr:hypothetical protein [bacterium]
MKDREDFIRKLHESTKEIVMTGTEVLEMVYKASMEILVRARQDAPDLLDRLVKKGEEEWEEARTTFEPLFRKKAEALKTVQNEIFKVLDEIREKIIKELPLDLTIVSKLIHEIEERFSSLGIPVKKTEVRPAELPFENYDELSVKKIVPRLDGLDNEQLRTILNYEQKHLNRVTIIRAINKRLDSI